MIRTTLLAAVAGLSLAACDNMSPGERAAFGGLTGAAAGVIAADALQADRNWTIIAGLGGAAAGVMVARNNAARSCAYSDGRGGYFTRRC